jgi:hypothetical protein
MAPLRIGLMVLVLITTSSCDPTSTPVDLDVAVLEDTSASLDFEAVARHEGFRPLAQLGSPNFGYSASAFWGRLTIHNREPVAMRYLIELVQPYVERADFYEVESGRTTVLHAGRDIPFSQRLIAHRHPVFPADFNPNETRTFFVRISGEDSLALSLRVHTVDGLARDVSRASLGFGLYYGLILAMALYNLSLAFVTKDKRYFTYVLSITSAHGFFSLVESGVAFEHWWPESPGWNRRALPFSIALGLVASLLFCQQFLETKTRQPRWHRALLTLLVACALHVVIGAFLPFRWAISSAAFLALVSSVAVVGVSGWSLRQDYIPARFFLLGWSCVSLGTTVVGLKVFGLTPVGWFFDNAFRLGSAFEVLLLSFALGDRITMMRRQSTAALREAQKRTDALNAELNARITDLEKTHREVVVLNESLQRQIRIRTEELADRFAKAAHAQAESRTLAPGSMVEGRYRVMGSLGAGGMGEVYEVERVLDGKRLALKVLSRSTDPVALARFAREANVIASLKHPNVVSVCDVEMSANGLNYLVMELVPGSSLKHLRERYGDVEWGLQILAQLAAALSAVHRAGVVHRDVKPANVIVTGTNRETPHVTLVDFGASALDRMRSELIAPSLQRLDGSSDSAETVKGLPQAVGPSGSLELARIAVPSTGNHLTQTGYIVGTPRYMAPELALGPLEVGPAVDIFAFGILAYEVLLGRGPFEDDPLSIRVSGRALPRPPPLPVTHHRLQPEAALLIERCILEAPTQRPSADELVSVFSRIGVGVPSAKTVGTA